MKLDKYFKFNLGDIVTSKIGIGNVEYMVVERYLVEAEHEIRAKYLLKKAGLYMSDDSVQVFEMELKKVIDKKKATKKRAKKKAGK